mgnify:CR=1 FL=1
MAGRARLELRVGAFAIENEDAGGREVVAHPVTEPLDAFEERAAALYASPDARGINSSSATSAEAVVWSTNTAPGFMPA